MANPATCVAPRVQTCERLWFSPWKCQKVALTCTTHSPCHHYRGKIATKGCFQMSVLQECEEDYGISMDEQQTWIIVTTGDAKTTIYRKGVVSMRSFS